MASLTQTRKQIRLAINVVLIAVVLFLGYRIVSKIFRRPTPPPPEEVANFGYGKLPFPEFEALNILQTQTPTYKLDLVTPSLPETPKFLPVFKTIPKTSSLFGPDRVKEIAKKYGFEDEPQIVSETLYGWKQKDPPRNFSINAVTQNFNLSYDWHKDSSAIIPGSVKSESQAESLAVNAVKKGGVYPTSVSEGSRKVTFLKLVGGEPRIAQSPHEYALAKVDFFKKDVSELPVVNPHFKQALISVVVTNTSEAYKDILNLDFNLWNYEKEKTEEDEEKGEVDATYDIRTSTQLWEEIQSGKGSWVYLHPFDLDPNVPYSAQRVNEIRVKKVYLAYYDSQEAQSYLQPIYVLECESYLEGNRKAELIIYSPAIVEDWLSDEATTENSETPTE